MNEFQQVFLMCNLPVFLLQMHCAPSRFEVCKVSLTARPAAQTPAEMKYSLTDWETSSPLSVSPGTEWVDTVSSSHNKHFSKWASSDDKLGHIECSASVFPVQVSDDAVQQRLYRGRKWGGKSVFGDLAGQQCFRHLTHSWTHTASTSCCKDFHWIPTKSLCCHFNFSLTYGIICLNACGYHTYYFTRVCPSTCKASPIN